MGHRKYRGPVKTVEQAMMADMPVWISCQKCPRWKQMHAFNAMDLLRAKKKPTDTPLNKEVVGIFRCRCGCNRVIIAAPLQWSY